MKSEECPFCESEDLGDRWCKGRMLRQYCHHCGWKGDPRVPETIPIEKTKWYHSYSGASWHYNIFDKYGHVLVSSRGYDSKDETIEALKKELKKHNRDSYRPCTGVIWPGSVEVEGEVFANE